MMTRFAIMETDYGSFGQRLYACAMKMTLYSVSDSILNCRVTRMESIFASESIPHGKATLRPFYIIDAWRTAFVEWSVPLFAGHQVLAWRRCHESFLAVCFLLLVLSSFSSSSSSYRYVPSYSAPGCEIDKHFSSSWNTQCKARKDDEKANFILCFFGTRRGARRICLLSTTCLHLFITSLSVPLNLFSIMLQYAYLQFCILHFNLFDSLETLTYVHTYIYTCRF